MAKVDLLHVPYKGGGPALKALLGGDVDAAVADPLAALPLTKVGKLRALAVTSARRAVALPDVPTVAESGVPGYEAASWPGIVVPGATPAPIVDTLYRALEMALNAPDVAARLSSQLYQPVGAGPQEFARFAAAENDKWSRLIRQLGVRRGWGRPRWLPRPSTPTCLRFRSGVAATMPASNCAPLPTTWN